MIESPYLKVIRTEGALETRRSDLLSSIEWRFQEAPPDDLRTAIENSNDLTELRHWLQAVCIAPTLEAFRAAIGR